MVLSARFSARQRLNVIVDEAGERALWHGHHDFPQTEIGAALAARFRFSAVFPIGWSKRDRALQDLQPSFDSREHTAHTGVLQPCLAWLFEETDHYLFQHYPIGRCCVCS